MDPICQPNTRRPFCETPNPQLSTNPGLGCNSSITPRDGARAGATAIREANVIFGQLICRTWEVNPVGHPNLASNVFWKFGVEQHPHLRAEWYCSSVRPLTRP